LKAFKKHAEYGLQIIQSTQKQENNTLNMVCICSECTLKHEKALKSYLFIGAYSAFELVFAWFLVRFAMISPKNSL
jgi:hypothetical protein